MNSISDCSVSIRGGFFPICGVVVNCYQNAIGPIPSRSGSRVILCDRECVNEYLGKDIMITTCKCGGVCVIHGTPKSTTRADQLEPGDPRSIFFCQITNVPGDEKWGQHMGECYIWGSINVHRAMKFEEIYSRKKSICKWCG